MIRVRKFDGSLELYDQSKVIRTAIRMGLDRKAAEELADEISSKVYDGIPTSEILSLIHDLASKIRPELKYIENLREAISAMRPKPDFEEYVRIVLKAAGYMVEPGRVLEGRCIDHEIDGIAFKDDEVAIVETKHHVNPHAYTGLDTVLQLWAALEDLKEGYRLGFHNYPFTSALLVCNTKISMHAERYARCKGMKYMVWNYPRAFALRDIIASHKIYPITMLKTLSRNQIAKLGDMGIVTISQLKELRKDEVARILNVSEEHSEHLLKLAEIMLQTPR